MAKPQARNRIENPLTDAEWASWFGSISEAVWRNECDCSRMLNISDHLFRANNLEAKWPAFLTWVRAKLEPGQNMCDCGIWAQEALALAMAVRPRLGMADLSTRIYSDAEERRRLICELNCSE